MLHVAQDDAVCELAGDGVVDLRLLPRQLEVRATCYDVAIVGMGYVGLPTALAFSAAGASVMGLDVSSRRLDVIRGGTPDLLATDQVRLVTALEDHNLALSSSMDELRNAAAVIICVPTPVDAHLVPDLRMLAAACDSVVAHAQPGQVLLLTSTSYVGTTRDLLVEPLRRRGFQVGQDIFVAFSPERIDPGNAGFPQESVPRVVGGVTAECTRRASDALSAYARRLHVVSNPETAELTKLFENTFRAVNIALVNELADLTGDLGVDVVEVIDAASSKPYGFMPFMPGPGVGGHCIPCDPHYLLWQLKRDRRAAPIIEQAMAAIAQRPRRVVERVRELLSERGRPVVGARILIAGAAYKAGVADVRESPVIEIIERLQAAGAHVRYVDPLVPELRLPDGSALLSTEGATLEQHDLVVLCQVHPGATYAWLAEHQLVLDTTYRHTPLPQRVML